MLRFEIPIYGGKVIRCLNRQELERTCKRMKLEPPDEKCRGWCQQVDGNDGSVQYLLCWYDRNLGTLVHEVTHLGTMILSRAGINPAGDNAESLAYLTDWLFMALKKR
jgi:hypothetical protein